MKGKPHVRHRLAYAYDYDKSPGITLTGKLEDLLKLGVGAGKAVYNVQGRRIPPWRRMSLSGFQRPLTGQASL